MKISLHMAVVNMVILFQECESKEKLSLATGQIKMYRKDLLPGCVQLLALWKAAISVYAVWQIT